MKSEVSLYNHSFSHIYVEKNVMDNPRTLGILKHFPNAEVIEIEHYKDVFCRTQQNVERQKKTQALIIARKQGNLVYEGAKVCQSFGNEYFYYTSCIMNCIYDCDYCYLKGMYPSGNIVIFVNIDDIFAHNSGKALNKTGNKEGIELEYVTTSNLYWNYFELNNLKTMLFKDSEIEKCTVFWKEFTYRVAIYFIMFS